MKESDLAYVGALFDYFGYLFIKAPFINGDEEDLDIWMERYPGKSYDYNIHLNMYVGVYGIKKLIDLFDMGQVSRTQFMSPAVSTLISKKYGLAANRYWKISGANVQTFLSNICPFVGVKKPELMLGLEFFEDKKRTLDTQEKLRRCWYLVAMSDIRKLSEKSAKSWVGHGRRSESFR